MPLVGDAERAGHAGHAAADDQRRLVDGQVELLQRLQVADAGDRHPDDVLGLLGGLFLLLGVHPGAVLADVGHVEEVLVDAGLAERVPEQRLVRSRRAGRDDHAVEPLLPDRVGDLLRRVGGAENRLSSAWTTLGSVSAYSTAEGTSTMRPMLAPQWQTKTPTSAPLRRRPAPADTRAPWPACPADSPAARRIWELGAARGHDRLGDVDGPLEGAADEDSRRVVSHRVDRVGLAEPVGVEFDAEVVGEVPDILGRVQGRPRAPPCRTLLLSRRRRSWSTGW